MNPRRALATASALAIMSLAQAPPARPTPRPMSVHNRLLLNRLAIAGHRTLEVMLVVNVQRLDRVAASVNRLGGRVRRTEPEIGYLRVEIAVDRLITLVDDPDVDAYQIASLSRGSWYRDGPPQSNAEMFRGFEVEPAVRPSVSRSSTLPFLSSDESRGSGYTADDVGVGEWLAEHPTFDGRGVTIALLESGQPEFAHPTLGTARTIDGRDISKVSGILNTIDPDDPDETRVELSTGFQANTTWQRVGGRTYILPRPGLFRFGVFTLPADHNLTHEFGVLRDEVTTELWVDTNGDADFRDETPIADVNTRFDVRTLRVTYPRRVDLSFVVAASRQANQINLYTARGGHQAMTVSVAAGSRTDDGLAFGVAPAARVLLVRNHASDVRLRSVLEGYVDTIKRSDVDILCDSAGILMVPDTADDFIGLFFRRLIAVYRKPIFHGAGNSLLFLNNVSALGDVFSVGGTISERTFTTFYGGAALEDTIVHPLSVAGPALDGALKPDFVAPMHRVAAGLLTAADGPLVPKNAPTWRLPIGYGISCCTSASSPYAAGVAALLISAAKQQRLPYSVESLGRALRFGARFLANTPAHEQGNGVLDIESAWRELQRPAPPRVHVTGTNRHALTAYARSGGDGAGIFERDGWAVGMRGRRELHLRRESGVTSARYAIDWTGNDGTFTAPSTVALPLDQDIVLPIHVAVASPGVHSAILNVRDPVLQALVVRSLVTIVATEPVDGTGTSRFSGSVPLMRSRAHYISVPDATALRIDLEIARGSLTVAVLPSHGVIREYYPHVQPLPGRTFGVGKYTLLLPNPSSGTWSITLTNESIWRQPNRDLVTTEAAEYSVTVTALSATLSLRNVAEGRTSVAVSNNAAAIDRPGIQLALGTLRTFRADFDTSGLPNQFALNVPASTASFTLRAVASDPATTLEVHLYDCSTGECFSYDFTVPAARVQTITVRDPAAGRWIIAVNAAPAPTTRGSFVLEEIVAGPTLRRIAHSARLAHSAQWTETVEVVALLTRPEADTTPILIGELFDDDANQAALAHPWESRPALPNLGTRAVSLATAVWRLK